LIYYYRRSGVIPLISWCKGCVSFKWCRPNKQIPLQIQIQLPIQIQIHSHITTH